MLYPAAHGIRRGEAYRIYGQAEYANLLHITPEYLMRNIRCLYFKK